ncbi:MAG: hypothetical protein GY721_06155, partial [Deltaproteobacteria bacterium]|nr:hypothetical protein [Deltaproteobacteria bacterium]
VISSASRVRGSDWAEELRDLDIYPIGSLIDILFYEEHEEEPRVLPKVSKRLIDGRDRSLSIDTAPMQLTRYTPPP